MSVELSLTGGAGGDDATRVGGSKPLHRILRAQPKTVGIVVLILGTSSAIVSIALNIFPVQYIWTLIPRGLVVGSLSFISGILFILTEHKPSKKTVVASLAFSVMSILGTVWSLYHMVPDLIHRHIFFKFYDYGDSTKTEDDTDWHSQSQAMGLAVEVISTVYGVVGVVIFIAMSSMAVAALRSAGTQAVVVMTAAPAEAPVE